MTLLSILLNPWLHTISALLAPFALRILPMFRRNPSSPSSQQREHQQPLIRHTPLRAPATVLLALYALYTLFTLAFARPPNLFTALHLPLYAPQSTIRAALLRQRYMSSTSAANGSTSMPELPPALEKLLARLASFDARTILVRCVIPVPLPPTQYVQDSRSPPLSPCPLNPDARLSFHHRSIGLYIVDSANERFRRVHTAHRRPTTRCMRFPLPCCRTRWRRPC